MGTFKEERKAKKLTLLGLVKKLKVSINTVCNWQSGRSAPNEINREKLRKLGFSDGALPVSKYRTAKTLFRAEMAELRLTIRKVAEKLKVSEMSVYSWASGKSIPKLYNALNLMDIGFSIEAILPGNIKKEK